MHSVIEEKSFRVEFYIWAVVMLMDKAVIGDELDEKFGRVRSS